MDRVQIKPSMSVLVFKIITIEFIAALIYLFFIVINKVYPGVFVDIENRAILEIYVFLALFIFRCIAIVFTILAWRNIEYAVTSSELIIKRGLFSMYERHYSLQHVESVSAFRPVFGTLLGYGNILIKLRMNKSPVVLAYVSNPSKCVDKITHMAITSTQEERAIRTDTDNTRLLVSEVPYIA